MVVGLEESWDVADEGGVFGDELAAKGVGGVRKGDLNGVGGDRGGLEGGGGFVGVDFNNACEGVGSGCCGIVPDNVWIWKLSDLGLESGDCFVAAVCCHRVGFACAEG